MQLLLLNVDATVVRDGLSVSEIILKLNELYIRELTTRANSKERCLRAIISILGRHCEFYGFAPSNIICI